MDSRREFLKKAALLSSSVGLGGVLPESIQKAMAIDPAANSSYLDAEHVVILMQENRSFDHAYGKLQGVRGFNDPRAISLPDKNRVWLQTDEKGHTYAPFHLDIRQTKATWMHDLPHSRESQVDAYNGGKYDKWLTSKRSTHKEYADMPLTLGHYDRQDLPFYYALADAFTICDQNFCSSMTPTHPNRYYLWSGTIREEPTMDSLAVVRNSYFSYNKPVKWKTFPERLQEAGVSWAFYQNEVSAVMQFNARVGSWLGNFGCNPLERYAQYHVKFSRQYLHFVRLEMEHLKRHLPESERQLAAATGEQKERLAKIQAGKRSMLEKYEAELAHYSAENFKKLSAIEQEIHNRAFVTNVDDPDYLELSRISYQNGTQWQQVEVPKSDVLYQFRKDVDEGRLPAVSYLAAPQNFSDHPSAPWYGAWFVSEVLDILTRDPEVWKKTIFILCYDENDGYYDHIPPFSIPNPFREHTGKVSDGIDIRAEYVTLEQDLSQVPRANAREGAIGLGFRVPLVVASPWSRGGRVNSQVFDHTSIIQFLEEFASHKAQRKIRETNITEWRRAICGNISSVFQPYEPAPHKKAERVNRDEHVTAIHRAQFRGVPANFKALTPDDIKEINRDSANSPNFPRQEPGTRPSCAVPYELYVGGELSKNRRTFQISMHAAKQVFGERAAGSPFLIYAMNPYQNELLRVWNYAVRAGDTLEDRWKLDDFEGGQYHLRVYGPNGFFREFAGNEKDLNMHAACSYVMDKNGSPTGDLQVEIHNRENAAHRVQITDNAYHQKPAEVKVAANGSARMTVGLSQNHGWYDFNLKIGQTETLMRFAGHVETGKTSSTDPYMGGL